MVQIIQYGENPHCRDFPAPENLHEYQYFHDGYRQHGRIIFVLCREFYFLEFGKVDAHEITNELSLLISPDP